MDRCQYTFKRNSKYHKKGEVCGEVNCKKHTRDALMCRQLYQARRKNPNLVMSDLFPQEYPPPPPMMFISVSFLMPRAPPRSEMIPQPRLKNEEPVKVFATDECSICIDEMKDVDAVALHCGHVYHKECIQVVAVNDAHPRCPDCREVMVLADHTRMFS